MGREGDIEISQWMSESFVFFGRKKRGQSGVRECQVLFESYNILWLCHMVLIWKKKKKIERQETTSWAESLRLYKVLFLRNSDSSSSFFFLLSFWFKGAKWVKKKATIIPYSFGVLFPILVVVHVFIRICWSTSLLPHYLFDSPTPRLVPSIYWCIAIDFSSFSERKNERRGLFLWINIHGWSLLYMK